MNGSSASYRSSLCLLSELGQSVWLDDISRPILTDGTLARLIAEDCISGLTSNPVIFERALRQSDAYDSDIIRLAATGASVDATYERLVEDDIRAAADLLRPAYNKSRGVDGYVSLEVSPHLARDADGTVAEAVRLWSALDRPNVLIKVPGTVDGITALRALIAQGINVNVTLLFGPDRYREIADAFLGGLEDRIAQGRTSSLPHSVASFFLSRIDTMVDDLIDRGGNSEARGFRGTAAIASAKIAYRHFTESIATDRWRSLAARGAAPQRLLWASTGTKDRAYSDVKYVESLVAPDTINTMPDETIAAFRDHGRANPIGEVAEAADYVASLAGFGIDMGAITAKLEEEGIGKFADAFDDLRRALAAKISTLS